MPTLRVYDHLRRQLVDFVPVHPGKVGMYVCGLTPQDRPHVGHMRSFVAGDVMRRYLEYCGYDVTYVQNFTDIDDRIITKANDEGVDYTVVAARNIEAYFRASDALHIRRATVYPYATQHIPEILDLISKLISSGHAYAAGGDVFYAVESFAGYGKLSGKKLDELRAGSRIEIDEDKRNPLDFVLWKGAKPGEPSWETPWGPGRPGWHIECSAMAMKYLGTTLDLHGGGEDLFFPHHENEIAQSEAATGQEFCRHWVEARFVNLSGEKMSKSTGHFVPVEDVVKDYDPEALRLYVIATHYRTAIEFAWERVSETSVGLARLHAVLKLAREAEAAGATAGATAGSGGGALDAEIAATRDAFHVAMCDDFNTPRAVASLYDLSRIANRAATAGHSGALVKAATELRACGALLGLFWNERADDTFDAAILALADQREAARQVKEWATADALRAQLAERGVIVEDKRPSGYQLKRKG